MSKARGWSGAAVALGVLLGGVVGAGLVKLCAPASGRVPRARRQAGDTRARDLVDEQAEAVMEGEGGRTGW